MINSHLHIWSSVWADEYNKMIESTKTNPDESITSNGSANIMVDNKSKKRGNK